MKDLILVGIQGSGKGTQAKILAAEKGYQIFETGGALRTLRQEDSDLGRKIKSIIDAGDLVPNDIVMEIVRDAIDHKLDPSKPIIFDGIPRFEEQRVTFEALLSDLGREFLVVEISLDDEEAFVRLMKRAEIEGRADDNPESIRKRIGLFHEETQPLLEIWRDAGKVVVVNGDQSVEDVSAEIINKLS